ncbi:alcohol dehydrogenase catalytic domain-containing protein [Halostagnicola sp. A-GB9-2]|uniref:zinc-dependent alcohol dehydrogenase n=1 Tax=Halostagnicola sp. A-GB9-2 TaxID=3048066 RepID=UPI0024BF51DC|nr:alcohol dehydrogenase catalytic domain-containing protein [Halostagnicola sp. A-GB9-2]MDJ1433244.1 alcohol dehydrogenase catalytic domain-containing protein [Halostagnicola sp. A-GB9-2]
MKAIVHTGPRSIEIREREKAVPDDGEVLVRVHSAGLCGSDAHAYTYEEGYKWIPLPRIMGHEYSGEVVDIGDNVTEFSVGDSVVEEPIHDCGSCFQCKNGQPNVCQNFEITGMHNDGAYAEYTTVNPRDLHRIPDDMALGQASVTEPLSIATRAVFDRSNVTPGDTVLVEGPGPIGILVATVADSMGANVLVSGLGKDTAYRLPLAEQLGMDTVNVERTDFSELVDEKTDGIGFDVVFDTTGHQSGVEMAVEHVRKGGQVVVVGLPGAPSELFMTPVVRGEIDLNTSYGSTWRNFEQAIRLLSSGEIDAERIIDRSFSVDEPAAAFDAFLASETCKPVFSFSDL